MKLALSLPDPKDPANLTKIDPGFNPTPAFDPNTTDIGTVITAFGNVALYVGGFLMFFWAAWGVFDYLKAEGNKEALAKARKKIQWAIIGFMILIAAYSLSSFVEGILQPNFGMKLQTITDPTP